MARTVLITNPVAARTTADDRDAIIRVFRAAGWGLEVAETRGPGDARRFAAAAMGDGVDAVSVFGGDGTTTQAAAALVGTEVPLGLVPGGTGNILAGNLRIPRTPVAATELIVRGRSRPIDLGRLELEDAVHYFGVACGAGADARVMGGAVAEAKRRWGIGGYFAALFRVLPDIRSTSHTVTVDGGSFTTPAALVLVLNCAEMVPPLIRVRPDTRLDDGVLDVIVLAANSLWECARGIGRVLWNATADLTETPYLRYARGTEIRVVSESPEPVQYDGDSVGRTPFTATVVPGAIRVIAPGRR